MKRYVLLLIFLLAFALRVAGLNNYPVGFTPDEASFGYDAYSILKTGKDQWGKPFPLVLESFGDYKSPLYSYLTIPSVFLFGLNKFATRLPNALLGSLAIIVVYQLTKTLFKNKQIALWSSLLLVISPWHVMISRGAFEANLTTFFLPLGILMLLKKKYALAGLVFGLNLFTYHSAKFVTPLVVLTFVALFWDKFKKPSREIMTGVVVFGVFVLLTAYTMFVGGGVRVADLSITNGALEEAFSSRKHFIGTNLYGVSRVFHNKYIVTVDRFLGNYITYLSPQFLFASGPNEGTYGMIPGRGVLFWFVIPFFLFLRKAFFEEKETRKGLLFLFGWTLLSVIPAALAKGAGHSANRAAIMMPSLEILLGVGAFYLFEWFDNKKALKITFALLMIGSFVLFLEDYFLQSKYKVANAMLYGRLEAMEIVSKDTKKVIVDKSLSEPHIYAAFNELTNPQDYQKYSANWKYKEANVNWVDQIPEYQMDRYYFRDIRSEDLVNTETYFIGKPEDFASLKVEPWKIISYPNGEPAIYIVLK